MPKYRVIAAMGITIPAGTLITGLSKEQAARRGDLLEAAGKGRHIARANVGFKQGEVFGLDDEAPKALWQLLEPVEEKAAAKDAG
ncbi:MAG: hypothetical protein ACRC67_33350 [Inquilinus sp.]|uniref:hypothetical protein n=1 Tax=Inquilinus sp. TaxID=1932117 RepID=UPI003F38EEEB